MSSELKKIIVDGEEYEISAVPSTETLLEKIYPVGSIYMSVNNVSPQDFIGGTWEAWGAGRVPVGVDTSDTNFGTVEETGGEATHTLTESEMPKHRHGWSGVNTGTSQTGSMGSYPFRIQQDTVPNWPGSVSCMDYAGGDGAHNNLQPYITCYMWKRTA